MEKHLLSLGFVFYKNMTFPNRYKITEMKFAITNVPIYIGYIILPLISFICGIVRGNGNVNYELVWLMLPVLLLPFANRYSIKIQIFVVIISLTILLTVKYLLPILWINNITWRAFLLI